MKPSHYTTPRQLSDCAFIPSADPITRPVNKSLWRYLLGLFK